MHLLLRQPGDTPVILLILEGVTQSNFLSMVLYEITLVPLVEDLSDTDPTLLSHFYADDVAFDGLVRWSAAQLRLLIDWGTYRGYVPELVKLLFIDDNPEDEEAERPKFEQTGL